MRVYNEKQWWLTSVQWAPSHGSIFLFVVPQVIFTAIISLAAIFSREYGELAGTFDVPLQAHTILGVCLSFLLVARVVLSHQRYIKAWEAYMAVGAATRGFVRSAELILRHKSGERCAVLGRHARLFMATARAHVRRANDMSDPTVINPKIIDREEMRILDRSNRRPFVVSVWMGATLSHLHRHGPVSQGEYLEMQRALDAMCSAMQQCRALLHVPLPYSLAQLVLVFNAVFVYTLPFALVSTYERYTAIPACVIAFFFFGINAVGVYLEDPYGAARTDLPLEMEENAVNEDISRILESSHAIPMSVLPEVETTTGLGDSEEEEEEEEEES